MLRVGLTLTPTIFNKASVTPRATYLAQISGLTMRSACIKGKTRGCRLSNTHVSPLLLNGSQTESKIMHISFVVATN